MGKRELEALIARIESAVKAGDAADPQKKAAVVADLRKLKAELHGPLDDLLDALEEDAVGLEATHPLAAAFLEHSARLLASIGL